MSDTSRGRKLNTTLNPAGTLLRVDLGTSTESGTGETLGSIQSQIDTLKSSLKSNKNKGKKANQDAIKEGIAQLETKKAALLERQRNAPVAKLPETVPVVAEAPVIAAQESAGNVQEKKLRVDTAELTSLVQKTRDQIGQVIGQLESLKTNPVVLRDAYRAALASVEAASEQVRGMQAEQSRNQNMPAVMRFEMREASNQLQELKADFQRQVLPYLNTKNTEQVVAGVEKAAVAEQPQQPDSVEKKPEPGDFSDIKDTEITFQPASQSLDDTLQFIEDRVAITKAQADADEQRRERVAQDALMQINKAPEQPRENKQAKPETVSVEGLAQTTSDTVYPSFEVGGQTYQYALGEYVLYKVGDRWRVGAIQSEPKVTANGARIDFRVQDTETKTVVDVAVEKPLKKFKPLERKKVRVNGVDYAIEGGHVGVRGEVEYNLVSQKNEVVPNIDIEMIRSLQEAEKARQEFSQKISEIETKIAHLATHKAREVALQFNKIQARLQKFDADSDRGNVLGITGSREARAMERFVATARLDIMRELTSLERSIDQQIDLYKKYEIARTRKTIADDMLKEIARMRDAFGKNELPDFTQSNIPRQFRNLQTPSSYRTNDKFYTALDQTIFEKISTEPGNIVYSEVQRRLAAHLDMLKKAGQTDKNLDKRHLIILEQVLTEWSKEEIKAPKPDFEKESKELLEKCGSLREELDKLEETHPDGFNKLSSEISKLEAMVAAMKEDDPKLLLQSLQAWQAVGKIELALKSFEFAPDTSKHEVRPPAEIDLPGSMLFEFLAQRPHEVRKVLELMYLSEFKLRQENGKNVPLAAKGSLLIEGNYELTKAMQDLFTSIDNLPKEGMAKLRMMGVRDWESFKKLWDDRYAEEVGLALYQDVAANMKRQTLAAGNKVISSKAVHKPGGKASWFGRIMGAGGSEAVTTEHVYEKDEAALQRVSKEMFEKRFGKNANGVSSENLEDMLRMFSAEVSIAMRKINIELAINESYQALNKLSTEDRAKKLAEIIGIEVNQVSHMVVEENNKYYLTQNGHEILRAQIETLERRVGLLGAGETPDKKSASKNATATADRAKEPSVIIDPSLTEEIPFVDDSYVEEIESTEKLGELRGIILNIQSRVDALAKLKKKHTTTSAWAYIQDAKAIMPHLRTELQQLHKYLDGTDADKTMVALATSSMYRPMVEEVMRAGLEVCDGYKRGQEKHTAIETTARVEQGLAKIETAGQRLVAGIPDKGHRLVLSRLRKAAQPLALAALFGGAAWLQHSSSDVRPRVEAKKAPVKKDPKTPAPDVTKQQQPVEIKIPPVKSETKLPEKQVGGKEIVSVENFLNPSLDNLLSKPRVYVPEGHDVKKDLAAAWQQMDIDGYGTEKLRKVIMKAQNNALRDPSITNGMLQALYTNNKTYYDIDSLKRFLDEQSKSN